MECERNPAMFDILEADIVVFQETKIQRKDLVDDMVLVPGWDCYWSLPKHKKGYSGVVIYTRQSICAPIRAEEGITGVLCPPNSSTSFADGPEDQQIGGYPTVSQLEASAVDATTLDSEGRCVILEFPAFVLLGVYSPANRDETRDDFRLGFLDILDARVRNLVAMGKRVFLTGDLNISRDVLDTANAEAAMRKNGLTPEDYISTPSRRMFNQLLEDGKVIGKRDAGREKSILWDICRGFHLGRRGMFTCWEQKVNARPGNYGARIDYVLCSLVMRSWYSDSNIQEGLMDRIHIDGEEVHTLDVMNPTGMFVDGERQREHAVKDMLPLSGKLIPEFDGRRNIKDMFARKPSVPKAQPIASPVPSHVLQDTKPATAATQSTAKSSEGKTVNDCSPNELVVKGNAPSANSNKRSAEETSTHKPLKRFKSASTTPVPAGTKKGQQSLKGFFQAAIPAKASPGAPSAIAEESRPDRTSRPVLQTPKDLSPIPARSQTSESMFLLPTSTASPRVHGTPESAGARSVQASPVKEASEAQSADSVHDPIQSKESWSKLFTKPASPRCEGHEEPCKTMLTKKS
ncbi:MAG: hypothetical protein Q9174_003791, partial [Haloplaca sp. 1 TL-2023]